MDDLRNATLADVHHFYDKWYGPNNATLVIAGDFDNAQVKSWIEKYFGEIKASEPTSDSAKQPVKLEATKRAYHEDNFAKSPELSMVFPSVYQYHPDVFALQILDQLLGSGKKAPLYKVIVEEKKLAPSVSAHQNGLEIAGDFTIRVRAFPDKNLTDVENAIQEAMKRFETDKFTEKDLSRIKAKIETEFYEQISSVFNKAFQLALYNEYASSPGYITQDLQNLLNVTSADVWRVYDTYIKNKPYVLTSFVPRGQTALIASNSESFPVVEESIDKQVGVSRDGKENITVEKITSSFDRTIEPPMGEDPELTIPHVWQDSLKNGLRVLGIEQNELPLVNFSLTLKGGLLLDDINKVGVANLITDEMMQGTANKTPIELEEAIDGLGAQIRMYTTDESIVMEVTSLKSKLNQTFALAKEILLEPRWDEKEFARVKAQTIETIKRNQAEPPTVAENVFKKLVYGKDNILSNSSMGTAESVDQITMDDLKNFYVASFSPSISHVAIVGAVNQQQAMALMQQLDNNWPTKPVTIKDYPLPAQRTSAGVYFVNMPDAKQSEIQIGNFSIARTNPDYYPVNVMNYKLGGSFAGIVNLILREEKGYTYGARTSFSGGLTSGTFQADAAVQSSATLESVQIFHDEIAKYRQGISDDDLTFTKNSLIKSNARRFETLGSLLNMLNNIATYHLPVDYVKDYEKIVKSMTLEQHKELAQNYLQPDKMIYLIVGDAKTQLQPLRKLGLGEPVLLDVNGNRQ
jgi:zinc protease